MSGKAGGQTFQVRIARPEDASLVTSIIRNSIQHLCWEDHKNDPKVLNEWLLNKTEAQVTNWIRDQNNFTFLAENPLHDAVGIIMMNRGGELLLCYVLPEVARKGVGKLLLEKIESLAISLSLSEIKIASTKTARNFYVKHGYCENANVDENFLVKDLLSKTTIQQSEIRLRAGMCIVNASGSLFLLDRISGKRWEVGFLQNRVPINLFEAVVNWKERSAVISLLSSASGCGTEAAIASIDNLLAEGMLESRNVPNCGTFIGNSQWTSYGWEDAYLFHAHTNLLEKLDYSQDGEIIDRTMMEQFLSEEIQPPNYKDSECAFLIDLFHPEPPSCGVIEAFDRLIGQPKPIPEILSFEVFSYLIQRAFGETHSVPMLVTGNHVGKTSPSGGSRHPTEAYILSLAINGLENGIYHYSVLNNSLVPLVCNSNVEHFVSGNIVNIASELSFRPAAIVVLTSIFERSMFRYRDARSYRVIHFDVGHLLQTFRLLSAAAERPCYTGYGMNESNVEKQLSLGGLSEGAIAFCAIG